MLRLEGLEILHAYDGAVFLRFRTSEQKTTYLEPSLPKGFKALYDREPKPLHDVQRQPHRHAFSGKPPHISSGRGCCCTEIRPQLAVALKVSHVCTLPDLLF